MRFLFGGYFLIFLTRSRTPASQLNLNKDIRIFSYGAGERTPLRILAGGFPPAKILKETRRLQRRRISRLGDRFLSIWKEYRFPCS